MKTPFIYPSNPANVSPSITQPSLSFKKEVTGVMGSIVVFFIVYLLLFALAIALVIGCFYGGIAIITSAGHLLIIAAGLGLIGVGIMVFVFLVKFLFAVSKYDRSGIVEITEADQPVLFAFIRQLTTDTQTRFPRKIYLSADVNACVFYDSSFWSMFFPVKKNLQIGLGLVNALNVSEFKAVMAHEFGHFSQRSMKLGSFVYHVNKIIYNMLFDNSSYAATLQGWANIHGIFALFAGITAKIAESIQWVLKQMYSLINKNYMRLSREMEFHADAVAASVSGSKSLITALRRAEIANSGYAIALQKCDELIREKKITGNIYQNQTSLLLQIAADYKLTVQQNMPVVSDEFLAGNNLSRINYKDQWASHPATEDREAHLNSLAVHAEMIEDTAWVLFEKKEKLQEELTEKIYSAVTLPADVQKIGTAEFDEKVDRDVKTFSFSDLYNGYYDNRQIAVMDTINDNTGDEVPEKKFDFYFSKENALLPKKINATVNDKEVVMAIADKRIQTKTFDFDGKKYKWQQAGDIAVQLENEIKKMQSDLEESDKEIVKYFLSKARMAGKEEELKNDYTDYFELRRKAEAFLNHVNVMLQALEPIFTGQLIPLEEINKMIQQLKNDHEPVFKRKLKELKLDNIFDSDAELLKKINNFNDKDYAYFGETSFFENELKELHDLCNESWTSLNNYIFLKFKKILEKQLNYIAINNQDPVSTVPLIL